MKGKLVKSALFCLGVIIIAASLASGFITYYYPVYTEIGREEIPVDVHIDINNITYVPLPGPVFSTLIKYRTAYRLRDYALLTYLFSGIGLVLIVTDYALKERLKG